MELAGPIQAGKRPLGGVRAVVRCLPRHHRAEPFAESAPTPLLASTLQRDRVITPNAAVRHAAFAGLLKNAGDTRMSILHVKNRIIA